jgi:hypothetical protein
MDALRGRVAAATEALAAYVSLRSCRPYQIRGEPRHARCLTGSNPPSSPKRSVANWCRKTPNDEPASALLQRIRAQRGVESTSKQTRRPAARVQRRATTHGRFFQRARFACRPDQKQERPLLAERPSRRKQSYIKGPGKSGFGPKKVTGSELRPGFSDAARCSRTVTFVAGPLFTESARFPGSCQWPPPSLPSGAGDNWWVCTE